MASGQWSVASEDGKKLTGIEKRQTKPNRLGVSHWHIGTWVEITRNAACKRTPFWQVGWWRAGSGGEVVAWGGRTVARRTLGANHASQAPESGWPLPFHEVSGLGGFDCSCSRASFQENHQYHAHRRRAFFVEAKVAVGKNKASKATKAIDNWKGRVQREVLVERGARFRCVIRCAHRKEAPDGKPTPNAETECTSTAVLQQASLTLGQETVSEIVPDSGNKERTRQRKPGITSSPDSSSS